MVKDSFETKKKARQHIVEAGKFVQYMKPEESGDYPQYQRKYKSEISHAKRLLHKVYPPNHVIFDELDLNTGIGINASLGTLNIGDEPFIDMKRDTQNAETFNADSKEEARLKKYEKTYGEEGAKVRNRIFKRILAKADWGTKANQWSARKAQALTDEYEEAMKGKGKKAYKTSKRTKSQKSLKKWGDQKWKTKSGQDSSKTGERYLPEKAIKALTDKEYKKTSAKKRQDSKKGKQFSKQPKDIAKKVKKYRGETFEAQMPFEGAIEQMDRHYSEKGEKANKSDIYAKLVAHNGIEKMGQIKKAIEAFYNTKLEAETFDAESRPHSVDVSRSTNKEKKLMAVFEDKDGKKIKTTHFGARGMSDYTKHGDKERMELYNKRHKKNEHWNKPMTAGALSKHILWNKPSLAGSFNDYKRRFGLKGDLKVSRSAENFGAEYKIGNTIYYSVQVKPKNAKWWKDQKDFAPTDFEGAKQDYEKKVKLKKRVKLVRHYEDAHDFREEIMMINDDTPHKHRIHTFEAEKWSGQCHRCDKKTNTHTMSWFNTDLICMDCSNKEKSHPKYQEAKDKELEQVKKGNYNFEGIGFDAEGYSPEMEKARKMKNRYIPPNFKVERKDGRKYLFLDFDNTVRHTIPDPKPDEPKRRRPPHKAEEVVLIDGVKEKVHEWADAGYFVVGLTNQSNIESGFNTTQDVVDAIKRTLDLLDMQFPVYFASHKNKDLPDYNYRKPMTGMIDGAFRDFGSPNYTYSLMVGDDWEGADSGMARNANINFIGVLPFIRMSLPEAEHAMYIIRKQSIDDNRLEILNPDDLIPTFAEEYDRKMNTYSAEDSYSKSATSFAGNTMKMSMGTIVGVVGALILGYNAPALYNRYMKKETSEAESSVDSTQSLANQGFMEDWTGGNEGDDNLVSEGNEATQPSVSYSYDPFATSDATSYDPLTRPPSMV
jgi:HAD superfamily hydrolase (TIGR01662 family)